MVRDAVVRIWRRAGGQPGFYGVVVLCLGLGIGATTTVFAVADTALLRPLPFPRPSELVAVASTFPALGDESLRFLMSPLNVMGVRDRNATLTGVEALETANLDLVGDTGPIRLQGVRATPTLFETMGIGARVGRVSSPEDIGTATAVISEGLWNLAFGRSPDIVGRQVDLDGAATEIVGVVPDRVAYPPGTQVWLPWRPEVAPESRLESGSLQVVARLAPGVSLETASADLDRVAAELEALYPDHDRGRGIVVEALRTPLVRQSRPLLVALAGSVALFLVLSCTNVATLMLVRLRRRAADVALRHALGASRGRLLADALAEGCLLALAGAILGTGVAAVGTPVLYGRLSTNLPGDAPAVTDPRVLFFTAVVAGATVLAFAVGPALVGSRGRPAGLLTGSRGGTASRTDRRAQTGVVAVQAAVGVLLVVSASGAFQRLRSLLALDPGFAVGGTLTVRVPLQAERWADLDERTAFLGEIRERLTAIPAVSSAGATNILPLADPGASWSFSVEDRPPADESSFEVARGRLITPGYLRAAGIPILAGRDFTDGDRLDGLPVVIVSRRFTDLYWPGEDAVGKRIKRRTYGSRFPWMTVVGVTGDVRDDGPGQDIGPTLYMPYAQQESRLGFEMSFALRVTGTPEAVVREVRRTLGEVDPRMPIIRIAYMQDLLDDALAGQRSAGRLLGGFAAFGLVILALGVFGVTARVVQERTRELAIRVALGAAPGGVGRLVLLGALAPLALGSTVGLALVLPAAGPIESALGGTLDPPLWASVVGPALPLLVGALASLGPAIRAAHRNPAPALRQDR